MSVYELIMIGVTGLAGLWGYHTWLMKYIKDHDQEVNNDLVTTLKSIQETQQVLWSKLDKASEKLIVLDHTAVREERVRILLEEYRADSKQDNIEIKTILKTITENVEILKTEAAVNKALSQR